MSLWKVARDRGNQIARELNLRKSSEIVNPYNRRVFDKAVADMAKTPDAPARARLEGLFAQVRRRKELQTAVVLLDLAWRVPPDTRLEEDLVLMIRRCYLDAAQEGWRLRIRDELRDRQVHPFPNVRRVVHQVRQLDPVDDAEIAEIRELDRGYPDLRQSIAERVILHNQTEHLDATLDYLSSMVERKGPDPEEEKAARRLFSQLAASFTKSGDALEILYPRYLANYETQEPRGFLMLALAGYGDAIVPQLVYDHDANPKDRAAIEHVLSQIVSRGGVEATRALLAILRDAAPRDVGRTTRLLSKGLATLAGHAEYALGVTAVRDAVRDAIPVLERHQHPDIRRFLKTYAELEWGRANVVVLIDRVLDDSATDAHRQQIRLQARAASKLLVAVAEDRAREPAERRRALEALAPLRAVASQELAKRLWVVFQQDDADDIRVGVLHALSGLELDPGPAARDALFGLIQSGSPRLAEEIRTAWSRMFRAVGLTDRSSKEGGRP